MPLALIFGPFRRSIVSSMPTTTGPSGTNVATSRSSRTRAAASALQRAALSTRWKREKPVSPPLPTARSPEATVRAPDASSVPAPSSHSRSKVGRVNTRRNGAGQSAGSLAAPRLMGAAP